MKRKFCIVATDGNSLLNFRGPWIKYLVSEGYDVYCISVEPEEEIKDIIDELGVSYIQVEGDRIGTGIRSGFKMISGYKHAFKELQPDVCFLYMSKPIAFGGIAAVKSGVNHINVLVNGLENAYYRTGIKDFVVRIVMSTAYRFVSKRADNVFFQNNDDMKYFHTHNLLDENKGIVVGGSGVDMNYYAKSELPNEPVVLMVARLLWSKGIREYLDAVTKVKHDCPECKVLLVGGLDSNDEALTEAELNEYIKNADIEYCGFAEDVRPYLQRCSIFVLPSYHEGLPRSVIEAMSVGRPIITTDVPGCRETVIDGKNGYIVPVRNSEPLYERIKELVQNSSLRQSMAEESYNICKERFDVKIVNSTMLDSIESCFKEK